MDPDFRLVKGAYPFVLALLLTREGGSSSLGEKCPEEVSGRKTRIRATTKLTLFLS